MDDIDMALLRFLVRSPMHPTKLARSLGITEDEVQQRMSRLQDLGLVEYISPEPNA
jgi:DNA-binding Lrp family transcriptional regulator